MRSIFHCTVFLLVLTLTACVFPTRLADEVPYGEDDLGRVEVGKTTGEEIHAKFGQPSETYARGKWWVYHAKREMTQWFWFFCAQTGCGGGEFGGDERLYTLIIEFNEESVLQKTAVVREEQPCSEDGRVCYREGQMESAWDYEAPLIDHFGTCTVIIYGRTSAMRLGSVWIHITSGDEAPTVIEYRRPPATQPSDVRTHMTGGEAPAGHLTDRSFLQVPLKEGQFEIRAISPIVGDITKSIVLQCARGETHFVRLLYEEPNAASFMFVGSRLGRNETRDRSLRLLRDR